MNTPKSFEIATAAIIRRFGDVGPGVRFVCWQSLAADRSTQPDAEETAEFPQVNIRFAPPVTDTDGGATLMCSGGIQIGTQVDDDLDHAIISRIYAGVQLAIDRLYAACRGSAADAEVLTLFTEEMTAALAPDTPPNIGGVTFIDSTAPLVDDDVNIIGLGIGIHYSRNDF